MIGNIAAAIFLGVLIVYSIPSAPGTPKEPIISYEGPVQPDPPTLHQIGATEKPSIGPYQHRFRDLRLQLEVIKFLILRTGKTVPAETMQSISTDMEQLGTLLDPLPWSHPLSDRHAAILAEQLDSIKNRLDAWERHLEL